MSSYHVTWTTGGPNDRPHVQDVEATAVTIDTNIGFTVFEDAASKPVFSINNSYLISIERITEKD